MPSFLDQYGGTEDRKRSDNATLYIDGFPVVRGSVRFHEADE
jgi:hypothetical protein